MTRDYSSIILRVLIRDSFNRLSVCLRVLRRFLGEMRSDGAGSGKGAGFNIAHPTLAITVITEMNSKFCMRKPPNFHNALPCEVCWLRVGSVSLHTQSLLESRLLHLLSHEVVPAVATLPYQPDLMTQNRQVAHEADRCHGPGKNEARGLDLSRQESARSARPPLASGSEELSTEEEGASFNDKVT